MSAGENETGEIKFHLLKANGYICHTENIPREGLQKKQKRKGGRPINQRRTWNEDQRQKKKELQKKNWFTKGGFDVPLFVPHTPNEELAKKMKEVEAQNHQGRKVRFKTAKKGGDTLEMIL